MLMKKPGICVLFAVGATVLAPALLAAQVASADVGAIIVTGSAAPKERTAVQAGLATGAEEAGWALLARPLGEADAKAVQACMKLESPWACIAPTATRIGFDRAIVVSVDPEKRAAGTLSLTAQVVAKGHAAALTDRSYCEKCTSGMLETQAKDIAVRQMQALSAQAGETALEVASEPVGAVVSIDGTLVGETPGKFKTFAGKHTVMLTRSGYKTEVRTVEVGEGKSSAVTLKLTAEAVTTPGPAKGAGPGVPGPQAAATTTAGAAGATPAVSGVAPAPGGRTKVVPLVLMGVGGAAGVAGGIVAFAKEEIDYAPTADQPEKLFGSTPIGLGVGITGAVVFGAGLYLFLKDDAPQGGSAVIAPTPGGAMVGWNGRF